ncbi:hypothetical protein ANME2D_02731 [Candidatus Methanoperedens nitroreducens]|uniref:Uncharacterized protein n=1 Tax=Candidatus Methanoperedens nitratireducens TaxID=1392998 RepID=A0A062V245_9EURY|nr:hypothetical protein [Candidatus Methanoperedens nitroreducens]KCZ70708.1 hypothetical protein ANME2D_02731 [Candidatus Methanoperedens nitroreducens]MDJ1420562.1 hypothetical protein [Candidatus Methanoperedens sp.]
MGDFLDKLLKIQSGYFKRMRLIFILDLISIFSILYAVLIIFQHAADFLDKYSLPVPIEVILPILAFVTAIISALLLHRKDNKININLLIENKYSELKERLRTAYDNRNENNIIVDSLKDHVSVSLTGVSSSHLLATGMLITKILVTVIFISGAAMVSLNPDKYAIPPETFTNITSTVNETIENINNQTFNAQGPPVETDKVGTTGQGDIFGKPNIAPIEGKPVDLSLDSGSGAGSTISEYSPDKNQFIRSADFPVDVLGSNVSDGGYGALMKKTETEKELINKYAVERSKI